MTDERREIHQPGHKSPDFWRDEVDLVFEGANPNPSRIGCPNRAVLVSLARRERAISDPAYAHLTQCSPCYQEFRALRAAEASRVPSCLVLKWTVAAAALLVLAVAGMWAARRTREHASGRSAVLQDAAAVNTELDLRKYTVARSDNGSAAEPPVTLHSARLNLTILLPVGSEAGAYQVRVLDSNLRPRASGEGSATVVNYVTTLKVAIDLTSVSAGTYQLALRPPNQDWRLIPARIQ
jgi:hypothetical protein